MNPATETPTLSLWESQALSPAYDLLIVGAGLVGLSTALHFQQANPTARVAVLERTWGPQNASSRNAGFACFGSVGEILSDVAHIGPAATQIQIAARWEGLQLLRATLGDAALHYEPCGGNELFDTPAAFAAAQAAIPEVNSWLRDITGQHQVYRAAQHQGYNIIHNAHEGALHSGHMLAALLAKVRAAGVAVYFGQDVVGATAGELHLATDQRLTAPQIVLASSAGTALLVPELAISPGRGTVLITTPLPGAHPWQGTWHYDTGYVYWRHLPDDSLLLGGARNHFRDAETTHSMATNPDVLAWLVAFASNTLRLPPGWEVAQSWSGTMGFTSSGTPHLYEHEPGLWLAAGLGGMGVAIGMQVGKTMASLLG